MMHFLQEKHTQVYLFILLILFTLSGGILVAFRHPFQDIRNFFQVAVLLLLLWATGYAVIQYFIEPLELESELPDSVRAFSNALPDRAVVLNKDGVYVDVINRYQHSGVFQPYGVIGKKVTEIYPDQFGTFVLNTIRETIASDTSQILEYSNVNLHGQEVHYEGRIVPYKDSKTGERMVVWSSRDITERINAEKTRLELALERNKVQFLREFVSNMTHDFKTPLAIINTNTYLTRKSVESEKRDTHLNRINDEVKKLTQMVDDMLESARLESGIIENLDLVTLYPLLHDVVSELQSNADQKSQKMELIHNSDSVSSIAVRASARDLNRAFMNLIDNAIKYTPTGGQITVRLFSTQDRAVVEIPDTGIGIEAEQREKIFSRFYRTETGRFHTSGSGLGLAIVKLIVEQHDGQVELVSKEGQGSTFSVILPLSNIEASTEISQRTPI